MSEKQTHILVISQYFYPEEFRINDLVNEWIKRGYKVTVVTGIPNYPRGKFFNGYGIFKNRHSNYKGADIIRIPIISRGNSSIRLFLNYLSFVISGFFWKYFTRIKADLVFIFEVSPMTQALPGVWYAKKKKIPCYLYVQDLWPENVEIAAGIHNKTVLKSISNMVDYIYKRCDKIFVTSPSFVTSVVNRNVSEGKVVYLPQYAEDHYKPSIDKSSLIPSDGITNITFTGNIGTAQGLDILCKAASILKSEEIPVRFNIVGDGRNKRNLIDTINQNALSEYFNFIGWQRSESIPSILKASDAAFLSFSDNQLYTMTIPAKLQSYMACGIPIIASASGESKRIINEAQCGLVCKLGCAESLAAVIKEFMNLTIEDKLQMSENAIAYTAKHFNKSIILKIIDRYFMRSDEQ